MMRYWIGSQCRHVRSGPDCEKREDYETTLAKVVESKQVVFNLLPVAVRTIPLLSKLESENVVLYPRQLRRRLERYAFINSNEAI